MSNYKLNQLYDDSFLKEFSSLVSKTRALRIEYRVALANHLSTELQSEALWHSPVLLEAIPNIVFLLGSSRGGSSATVHLLSQQAQAARRDQTQIVVLPGEAKPHLVLSSIYFPLGGRLGDNLTAFDASRIAVSPRGELASADILRDEIFCELGYPIPRTNDLSGFALRIYGRLLLQWPRLDFPILSEAVRLIEDKLEVVTRRAGTPGQYIHSREYIHLLLLALRDLFPEIDLRLYDATEETTCPTSTARIDELYLAFQIEEPPFIVPRPWQHIEPSELRRSVLILKDPSDVWRMSFWQEALSREDLQFIHLTRSPEEAVNGLCEGWKYQFGFQSKLSPVPLNIDGYGQSAHSEFHFVNFSTDENLWAKLLSGNTIKLEEVAALQWSEAHDAILAYANTTRCMGTISFRSVRENPLFVCKELCNSLSVPVTPSLEKAARRFSKFPVMSVGPQGLISERWRSADNRDSILHAIKSSTIRKTARKLLEAKTAFNRIGKWNGI